jgi:hypothetical protein
MPTLWAVRASLLFVSGYGLGQVFPTAAHALAGWLS